MPNGLPENRVKIKTVGQGLDGESFIELNGRRMELVTDYEIRGGAGNFPMVTLTFMATELEIEVEEAELTTADATAERLEEIEFRKNSRPVVRDGRGRRIAEPGLDNAGEHIGDEAYRVPPFSPTMNHPESCTGCVVCSTNGEIIR